MLHKLLRLIPFLVLCYGCLVQLLVCSTDVTEIQFIYSGRHLVYFATAGINYLLNATAFNQSKTEGFKNALSNLTGVPACWINITDVTPYSLNPNGSLGAPSSRRLLQAPSALTLDLGLSGTAPWQRRRLAQAGTGVSSITGAALGIGSFLPSTNGNGVLGNLNDAYNNGKLADGILPDPLQLELLKITPTGVSHCWIKLAIGLPSFLHSVFLNGHLLLALQLL